MRGDRVSNTLRITNEGNEADDCYKAKENGFVLSSLGYSQEELKRKHFCNFTKTADGNF